MPWYSGIAKMFGFGSAKVPASVGPPTQNIGTGGTAVFGGFPSTPEKSPDLRGEKKYKTYDELKYNLEIVATAVRRTLMLAKGATWRVQPAENSGAEGQRIADAIDSILLKPRAMARPWSRVVSRQMMHMFDGAAIAVWTGKRRDDGLFGFLDIQPRPLVTIYRWDVETDGTLNGVWQRSPWTYDEIPIPRSRFVYNADLDLSDSPEGTGLLRHAAEAARILKRLIQIEDWCFETDLAGVPVAEIPYAELERQVKVGSITAAQRDDYISGVKDFIEKRAITPGRGLAIESMTYPNNDGTPSNVRMFGLELLKAGGTSQPALNLAIERWTRAIARIFGVEGLLIGDHSKGGFSLANDKTQTLTQIINTGLSDCADAFDQDLIGPLMLYNGWPKKLTPTMQPSHIMLKDVAAITAALVDLAKAGLSPDDPANNEVRELIGVSPAPEVNMAADATIGNGKPRGKSPAVNSDGSVDVKVDDLGGP